MLLLETRRWQHSCSCFWPLDHPYRFNFDRGYRTYWCRFKLFLRISTASQQFYLSVPFFLLFLLVWVHLIFLHVFYDHRFVHRNFVYCDAHWIYLAFSFIWRCNHDRLVICFIVQIHQKLWGQQERAGRPLLVVRVDAPLDEGRDLLVLHTRQRRRCLTGGHTFVDLGGIRTLHVRSFLGYHFQHTHTEGIYVNRSAIVFLVELWGHKLRRSEHRSRIWLVHWGGQAQITDPDVTTIRVYKNVVTLQVTMDDRRRLSVQVVQPLQDLNAPSFYYL